LDQRHQQLIEILKDDKLEGDLKDFAVKDFAENVIKPEIELPIISDVLRIPDYESPPITPELQERWSGLGLQMMANGYQPQQNLFNVLQILKGTEGTDEQLYYDTFLRYIVIKDPITKKLRRFEDEDLMLATAAIQSTFGFHKISPATIHQAINAFCRLNQKDVMRDWLISLKWDGTKRVRRFFADYCGAEDSDYSTIISKNFWVSLAVRGLNSVDQSKVDNMVILEGAQGIRKSTMFDAIGGDYYMEVKADIDSKDFLQSLSGKLIVEFAELDAFAKKQEQQVKKMLTSKRDTYRQSYGRFDKDVNRRCVFVGTTNDKEYLKDATGNRRFWPMPVTSIDIDQVIKDREQLFAEAVHMYNIGKSWFYDDEVIHKMQESRRQKDPWEYVIEDWLEARDNAPFRLVDLYKLCLGIDRSRLLPGYQKRVTSILRKKNWEIKTFRAGNKTYKRWASLE
jgi:predicted P-loop ATPase